MSKIPYIFRPIPDEFLTEDFLKDPVMMNFIIWIMKRVSTNQQRIPLKNCSRHLLLDPFEFMYGRKKCVEDTGISDKNARSRLKQLIGLGYIAEVASKRTSTFSVYRIVTEAFRQNEGQHIGQQLDSQQDQQKGHKQEAKIKEEKNIKGTFNALSGNVVSSFLSEKQKEDLDGLLAYCQSKELEISATTLARWIHNHEIDHIIAHIGLLDDKKKKIRKHEAWLEKALKEDYMGKDVLISKNRIFAQNLQKNKNWTDLHMTKTYCTHLPSGKDYQFNLPSENFQKMLSDCHKQYHHIEEEDHGSRD